ncbi:putative sam-dependent methyltransferase protein [Phaeoacremonium minimum UCRPA7]|uniref:Putative sam-dependent methyltransferase protein n=1 Tax=Phaeoacremonium minimum (strain UCR-PA7) TaxID=1286976 RepID=R8BL94_PHAM7|nr:putative sam-dependent methyltransferase protein [Phaeoacremonium minimum UCRPA7]EOO00171.1 putative sam-dependent methyltransferase protein [Phaeoacremonium minimum UCRPA7]
MAAETVPVLSLAAAGKIAAYSIQDSKHPEIELAQAEHRIRLINVWNIKPGSRVLEIGCGQGNCTAVLAEAVGPAGHVDAIDPAPGEYGAPFTLAQAQDHISKSQVGDRVTWHRAEPVDFLQSSPATWDVAVLAHCIWYFKSEDTLKGILSTLHGIASRVCLAEYALQAGHAAAVPHVLAALARGTLEAHKTQSTQNIQTPLSPDGVKRAVEAAGWKLQYEKVLTPSPGLLDGCWEVGTVVSSDFVEEIQQGIESQRVKIILESARDATIAATNAVGGTKKVQTMDVFVAAWGT